MQLYDLAAHFLLLKTSLFIANVAVDWGPFGPYYELWCAILRSAVTIAISHSNLEPIFGLEMDLSASIFFLNGF